MTEPGSASFGDAAGEMADETEVEVPLEGASASAAHPESHDSDPTTDFSSDFSSDFSPADSSEEEISGVDNWLEEGGPLEPQDVLAADSAGQGVAASDDVRLAERDRKSVV